MRTSNLFWLALTVGACGGSSQSDQHQDPQTLIQNACDNIVSLQCGIVAYECPDQLSKKRAESVTKGCGSAFDSILLCFGNKLTACSPDPSEVCSAEFDALDTCEEKSGTEDCSQGIGGLGPGAPPNYQKCDVSCPTWGARCETDASGTLACNCTTGSKSGTPFSATSCNEMSVPFTAQYCKG